MTMTNEQLHGKFGVTDEELESRAAEYEAADWSHMRFGQVVPGRPRVADEPLESITVKIPRSRAAAIGRLQLETGITRSEFVRRAIDDELMAMG